MNLTLKNNNNKNKIHLIFTITKIQFTWARDRAQIVTRNK